ncbi:oligosaccharide 4-alpha-D-glucosyltransferase-like [Maniola jurtina]|uniref:oligosaccharide 4-alpha-D-glucosyltransferase-like n=1 Tax=Maniola jurtina TaxID=191418 RepID=UPI001E68910D|nr:oligosaccharide 4-alpha-D-glucosyltransferase-like [Maniola jurtina]XP_045762305.1 oligosaccharide 4-alpha-D-glucosyltransferase-like [Maniola jurtina]XP_045762306.1 oligosaccharide 4-alpha-D-glucosyltransferase-like [Maniola jurtina]XP_045762307.1 oligosaccharide 4-alpha-D-glucosyltransferase-like [Maniola jurtina]XP_045762308.1 oligosaccharide 4-alpha-D-glucosyltransferase-like [Maniola jurtina]
MAQNDDKVVGGIKGIIKSDSHYTIKFETGEKARLNILNDHVFRYYMEPSGEFLEYPEPMNPDDVAKMTVKTAVDYGYAAFKESTLVDLVAHYIVQTRNILIVLDKIRGTMKVHNTITDKEVLSETKPLSYIECQSTQCLHQREDEYFFGGGMQNGRFTHKGEVIQILNSNDWTDGGVTSPCPFYWSSYGYGVFRNTWQPGVYDFGDTSDDFIKTIHKGEEFDAYFFINTLPKDILNDYYELTGRPILMPEYAYYEAHLNAFNRDYWVEVSSDTHKAILFEDGKYYKSYQPSEIGDKKGILESLNGEKNNYQFSARAMVDRYKKHDMPLGWFIPNDGYGSGYGQTDSLDGDIQNLKKFVDYSLQNGVEVALWTESNLHPADPLNPKKGERDLNKEVGIAKVVALKCDVAWIGSGYSFGLNAVENAAEIFVNKTRHTVRPMILMVDGWAGTQRYSGIWSGDQKGGEWEYIRFHIPTYIGTGLSGQPIVGSDMDGIYAGGCKEVNIRDYQWKAFTPLQLNMDGWGNTQKTPFSFDQEATTINRAYLKLKAMLMPYNYSIGYESISGLPMVRAMFLEFPEEIPAYTKDSQYQYMWGPNILVAPIYNDCTDDDGNSIRGGIYLPNSNQVWVDILTGEKYQGGKIYNNIVAPLWKIPVFVKDGSIIPMTNPNNNPYEIKRDCRTFTIYPSGASSFLVYEDDGISSDYLQGISGYATTKIEATGPESNKGNLLIKIFKTTGNYKNMTKERRTIIQIMSSKDVQHVKVDASGQPIMIAKARNINEFESRDNIFFYKEDFILNPYLNEHIELKQKFLLLKLEKFDVTSNEITIKVNNYTNQGAIFGKLQENNKIPGTICSFQGNYFETTATSITLDWKDCGSADFYEIDRDGTVFTNIRKKLFTFDNLAYESAHEFKIRSVSNNVASEWSNVISVSTHADPFKHLILGVQVTCSLPSQPNQEVSNLTDSSPSSMWHTDWGKPGQANPEEGKYIKLLFDLGDEYELDKVDYIPRNDAGNGTFLQIQYTYSTNNTDWSPLSDPIKFKGDNSVKTIPFNGKKLRYLQLIVLNAVGNFGSGRRMLFFKK